MARPSEMRGSQLIGRNVITRHRGQKHSTPLAQVWKCFQRPTTYLRSSNTLKGASAMKKSSAIFVSAIALGLAMVVPLKASAQGVTIYVGPQGYGAGYPAYAPYPPYGYSYPSYGYAYPSYGYGYGRPYYGTYWGQGRRVARRVYRRHERW